MFTCLCRRRFLALLRESRELMASNSLHRKQQTTLTSEPAHQSPGLPSGQESNYLLHDASVELQLSSSSAAVPSSALHIRRPTTTSIAPCNLSGVLSMEQSEEPVQEMDVDALCGVSERSPASTMLSNAPLTSPPSVPSSALLKRPLFDLSVSVGDLSQTGLCTPPSSTTEPGATQPQAVVDSAGERAEFLVATGSEGVKLNRAVISACGVLPPLNSVEFHNQTCEMDSLTDCLPPTVDDSFICAMDVEGLLLEQHAALSRDSDGDSSPRVRKWKKASGSSRQQKRSTSKRHKGHREKHLSQVVRGEKEVSTSTEKRSRSHKRHKKKHLSQVVRGEEEVSTANKMRSRNKSKKPKTPPPNAFVSVRIPSVEIHDKLKEVQDGMLAVDERVCHVLVPLSKLHLTLMVLRLEEEEDIKRAQDALQAATLQSSSTLNLNTDPLVLEFCGLGSFGRRVVFAELREGKSRDRLAAVAEIVRSTFEQHGLPASDVRGFTPHLTIAKTGLQPRRRGLKHIDKRLYETHTESTFGLQEISGLELLSMVRPRDHDGYYHCFGRCDFAGEVDGPLSGHAGPDSMSELAEISGPDSVGVDKSVKCNPTETEYSGIVVGHDTSGICKAVVDSEIK